MRKTLAILLASAVGLSTVPARANDDLIRFGVGIGAAVIGEVIKNRQSPQSEPRRQNPRIDRSQAPSSEQKQPRARAASTAQAPTKPKRVPDEKVKLVQQQLYDLGYTGVGKPDGYWGGNTERAILAFRKERGLPAVNTADDDLVAALKSAKEAGATTAAVAPEMAKPVVEEAKVVAPQPFIAIAETPVPEIKSPAADDYHDAVMSEGPVVESEVDAESTASIVSEKPQALVEKPAEKPTVIAPKVTEAEAAKGGDKQEPAFTISEDF